MRIISGSLGGRQFEAPKGRRTHPMSDKMRGALFSMLGDLSGLTLLDAFAGSGALSLEAVSRGVAGVVAIDVDKKAYSTMVSNARALDIDKKTLRTIRANASSWSDNNPDALFDVSLIAPPYDDLQVPLLQKLARHTKPNGLYVLDWPGQMQPPELEGLEKLAQRGHGDAQLVFYRKTS